MRFIIRDCKPVPVSAPSSPLTLTGDSPRLIYEFFTQVVEGDPCFEPDKEVLVLFCFDSRLNLRGWHLVALGTLNRCDFGIREVLRPVLLTGSYGFALAHNHPSGDPGPSLADRQMTRKIDEAATLVDLRLLDHVIIGKPAPGREPYFSFREAGFIV